MNEIINTIGEQINAKELHFAKFKLLADEKNNEVTVMKGKKFLKVRYEEGSDTYSIQKGAIKNYEVIEQEREFGFFFDQLQIQIEKYFPNFEYVMNSIRIVGVNC